MTQWKKQEQQIKLHMGRVRPAPRDPEFAAQLDKCCDVVCCGCCAPDYRDDNPEDNSSCCTIM